MRIMKALIFCAIVLTCAPAFAQDQANTNMQILLDKVKADKKLVVASNMELTEDEQKSFWPIYEAYQRDLMGINQRLGQTIASYADAYNKNQLTDDLASKLTSEALAIDQDELNLRKTYAGRLIKVLPAKKVARYLQIENKIRAAIRYDLAVGIPLVQ